jgi:hypothetical protein
MNGGLRTVRVNGYGIKIYDKSPTDSARGQGRGRGSPVGVARQPGGLFRMDVMRLEVKVAGTRHGARG